MRKKIETHLRQVHHAALFYASRQVANLLLRHIGHDGWLCMQYKKQVSRLCCSVKIIKAESIPHLTLESRTSFAYTALPDKYINSGDERR